MSGLVQSWGAGIHYEWKIILKNCNATQRQWIDENDDNDELTIYKIVG